MTRILAAEAARLFQRAMRAACHLAVAALLLVFAGMPTTVLAESTVARDARLGGDQQRTRFVADLSKQVEFRIFTLADPYRVIIDLPNVRFQLPDGLGSKGRGLVAAYRYGLIANGKARIVIDLKEPAMVDKAFVLAAKDSQPARLVVDLVRTSRKSFIDALTRAARRDRAATPKRKPKARFAIPAPRQRKDKGGKPVIIIDPGHGGIDPGAISKSGLKEKDVVFAFSRALRSRLAATGKYKVILTRTIDTYVALGKRVAFARKHEGDLFVSIHADSIPGRNAKKIRGATVYTLSEKASDSEARALANKENLSDVIAGVELPEKEDEVTGILIDLAMRETKNLSITFADIVLDTLKGKTPLMKKAHRFAGFRVLKAPDIPSVLIELGYMTNASDTKNLMSPAWREKVAKAIAQSIDKFFAAKARGFQLDRTSRKGAVVR